MNYTSTMQFIDLFRQSRALWDKTDVDYLNKEARQRQREMIGYAMGMTEVDVGKKISNLRTYYIREMVKRDKAIKQGLICPETHHAKWPYFDAIDAFLGDVVRKKRTDVLTAKGGAPDLHYMYVEEAHNSDSDNDQDDFSNYDDNNDISRDSTGSGGASSNITSTAHTSAGDTTGEGPLLKRAKIEPGTEPDCHESSGQDDSDSNRHPDPNRASRGSSDNAKPSAGNSGHQYPTPVQLSQSFLHSSTGNAPPPLRITGTRGSWVPANLQHNLNSGTFGSGEQSQNFLSLGSRVSGGIRPQITANPGGQEFAGTTVPPGMILVEEDDDWLFGRYIVTELKKIKNFKDKQLAKMKMTQTVTYAQLGMNQLSTSDGDVTNS